MMKYMASAAENSYKVPEAFGHFGGLKHDFLHRRLAELPD